MRNYRQGTRGIISITALLFLAVGVTCNTPRANPYVSGLSFTKQPDGGRNVHDLSCTFYAFVSTDPDDQQDQLDFGGLYIQVRWMSDEGEYSSKAYDVPWETGRIRYKTITTTLQAPKDGYLDGKYWVEVEWTDTRGSYVKKSKMANCIVPQTDQG